MDISNIKNTNWNQTRIGILGAGKSGIAAAKLGKHAGADVFISDSNHTPEILKKLAQFNFESGGHTSKVLESDLLVISPGISNQTPIVNKSREKNIPIVSEIEFASWFTVSPILALTGSNGKTTTVNLLHEMCLSAGKNSLLGGNVGIPFSENVLWEINSNLSDSPVHVLEISSFQLEHIKSFSPTIAGILNVSEDHMDRYDKLEDYAREKLKIGKNITNSGWLIYNADDLILCQSLIDTKRVKIFWITASVAIPLGAFLVYWNPFYDFDAVNKVREKYGNRKFEDWADVYATCYDM